MYRNRITVSFPTKPGYAKPNVTGYSYPNLPVDGELKKMNNIITNTFGVDCRRENNTSSRRLRRKRILPECPG